MNKTFRLPKFWVLATAQVVLVLISSAIWFYFRTATYLAGPPDPDTYAWSWDFQLVIFAIFRLPAILACTAIALAIERGAFFRYYRASALQDDLHTR